MDRNYTYGSRLTRLLRNWRFRVVKPWICSQPRILDLGCGLWARMEEQIEDYRLYVGLDSKKPLKEDTDKRRLIKQNLTEDWLPSVCNDRFDVILMLALMEHLKHPEAVLKKTAKVLADDGIVIITTPNDGSPARALHEFAARLRLLSTNAAEEHDRFYRREELIRMVEAAGLSVRHCRTFMGNLNHMVIAGK